MIAGFRYLALGLTIGCTPLEAIAQIIPPSAEPGREGQRFIQPPAPRAQPGGPTITLPSTVAPAGAGAIKLVLRELHIDGSTVYSDQELRPLYADFLGHEITLQQVYGLAQRITTKYGKDGYVLSRATVPPQNLNPTAASVSIRVVEGYVDKVEWPSTLSRYRDFFSSYAAKITAARPLNIRTIERYLLLAGDLPGLKFTSSLRASDTATGASTLVVQATEKPFDFLGRIDNRGTQARGPYEYLATATLNNLLGEHEALSLSYAGAFQVNELQYLAASYRQVITSEGLTVFLNGSHSWGRPGTSPLEALRYQNDSTMIEAGLSYPVIRLRESNLTLSGLFFLSDSHADLLNTPYNEDRLRGFRFRADADLADELNGISQFNGAFSQGISGLGSTQNGSPLASRAAGRVDFSKVEVGANRLQSFGGGMSLLLAAYGQYAFTPLLASEECGYGGRLFGRAFDPSKMVGDHCWMASAEFRYDISHAGDHWIPATQVYGFSDHGQVYNIRPAVGTSTTLEGTSVGAGLRFDWPSHFGADLTVARGVEAAGQGAWRVFFALTARY